MKAVRGGAPPGSLVLDVEGVTLRFGA